MSLVWRSKLTCRLTVLAAGFWLLMLGAESSAQTARYQPRTPTTSPYLNLTRNDTGTLANYFALVRPQINQQQLALRADALQRQLDRTILQQNNQVQQGLQPTSATGTGSWFMVPGSRVKFQNTTTYFPAPNQRRRVR